MSFNVDKEEFYETFAELQDAEGTQRALEWAWSAFDWTQQELRKEAAKSQSIVAEERAAVVAWLRKGNKQCREWDERENAVSRTYRVAADRIERGEHRRGETE
jgi:hypothetical protein